MQSMLDLLRRASALPVALASFALFALMIMTFSDVMLRSLFNAPIEAATELTRIFMAIAVFSVLPVISARGEHIAVDLTDNFFHWLKLERWRDGLVDIVCGVMLIWPVQRVWILAERARSYGDVTEYIGIPQFYIGWFIAAATALTALILIVQGLLRLVAPTLLESKK